MGSYLDKFKGKVMYHIMVDSFNRGGSPLEPYRGRVIHKSRDEAPVLGEDKSGKWCNDYYGGDLKGITMKLPYIKSLGVSILYLSPLVESQANHGYSASDYERVDFYKGKEEDLRELCTKAHEMGMCVIVDAVFNHTGSDSKYFNQFGNFPTLGTFQSKDSPYFDWYKKTYDNNGNHYFNYWYGIGDTPECDCYNPGWVEYITGVNGIIDRWYALGIDGLRLDLAEILPNDFIYKIREACHRNKDDSFLLGEVWGNARRVDGHIDKLFDRGLDSSMNYLQVDAMLRYFKYNDTPKFSRVMDEIMRDYPKEKIKVLMNFSGTHDISRGMTVLGNDEDFRLDKQYAWTLVDENNYEHIRNFRLSKEAYQKARTLLMKYNFTLCFMPGIFSIFYGDEVGMQGLGNIMNRGPFPWESGDRGLLESYRALGRIRERESFMEDADYRTLELNNNLYMFERDNGEEKMLTAVNMTSEPLEIRFPDEYYSSDRVYTLKRSNKRALDGHGAISIKKS